MNEDVLLTQIREIIKSEITGVKQEITGVKQEITGVKSEIADIHDKVDRIRRKQDDHDQRFGLANTLLMRQDSTLDKVITKILRIEEDITAMREEMPSKNDIVGALDAHTKAINDLEEERVANLAWRRRVDEKLSLGGSPAAA